MDKYRKKFSANNYQLYKEAAGKIEQLGMYGYEKGWADVMEKAGAADDTLMSLNSLFGRGHSLAYWARPGNKEKEFIAHAFENVYIGNEVFAKYMPDLYKDMQDTIKAILAKLK